MRRASTPRATDIRRLLAGVAFVVFAAAGGSTAHAQVGLGTFGAKKLLTASAEGATACSDSTPVTGSGTSLVIAPTCSATSATEGGVTVVANGSIDVQLTTVGTDLTAINAVVGGDVQADVLDQTVGFTKTFTATVDIQATIAFGAFGATGFEIDISDTDLWNCSNCFLEIDLRENGVGIALFRVGSMPVDALPRSGTLPGGGSYELRIRAVGRVVNFAPTPGVDVTRTGSFTVAMTFPEAQGACCAAGGTCSETTLSNCQAFGEFQGFGTLCATTTCGGAEDFVSWANGAGGAFETAGNWEPAVVPDAGDSARFNLDASYPVSVANGSLRRMLIDKSVVSLSGGQLSLVEQSLALPSLGIRGGGQLNLVAGTLSSSHAAIGDGGSLGGLMTVSGSDTAWQSTGRLSVGALTGGFLGIENGALVASAESRIGDGALALVTVVGEGSAWTTGNLAVGLASGASADLSIRDGGFVEADLVSVAENAGADGGISLRSDTETFAELETFTLRIGGAGDGSVSVEEGGLLSVAEIDVAGTSPGAGKLTVEGPQAKIPPPLLYVVRNGGVFEMASDAEVGIDPSGNDGLFGGAFIAGSAPRVTVRDDAAWHVDTLRVGTPIEGVDTGGANAIVEVLDGGIIRARRIFVGATAGASATVRVKGAGEFAAELDTSDLTIGGAGAGSVTVEVGGFAKVLRLIIGGASPNNGRLTVTGTGTEFFAEAEYNIGDAAIVTFDTGAFVGDANGELLGIAVVAGSAADVAVRNGARWHLNRLVIGGQTATGSTGTVRLAAGTIRLRDLFVATGGTLAGIGTVERALDTPTPPPNPAIGGTISPGVRVDDEPDLLRIGPRAATFIPGVLTIQDDVAFGATGVLRILGAGPGEAGVLHATGTLTLGGTLELAFPDGYLPKTGDTFAFAEADGGVAGAFGRVRLLGVAEDLAFTTSAAGNGVAFTALSDATACSAAAGEDGLATCERCDNCVDDDGDGLVDRDDPDCAPAANAAGQGVGDPAATKALLKCAATIASGGAKLGAGVAKRLQACADAVLTCVQTKPGDAGCFTKARTTCAKQTLPVATGGSDGAKVRAKIAKACGALPVASLLGASGLGYGAETPRCAALGVTPLDSLDALGTCLERAHVCRAAELFATRVPRARELLTLGAAASSVTLCLPLGADGNAAGLGDAKTLGKPAIKCQKAIAKAGTKLAASLAKAQQGCSAALLACAQGADPACTPKAAAKCAKAGAGRARVGGAADAALAKGIAKACAGTAPTDLRAAAGLGFAAVEARCAELGVPALGAVADIATCLTRDHACRAATLGEVAAPRLREFLAAGGVPVP